MDASELAEKAKEAFVDDDFKLAVDLYSKAIDFSPTSADFFADRAQANIKLNNLTGTVYLLCDFLTVVYSRRGELSCFFSKNKKKSKFCNFWLKICNDIFHVSSICVDSLELIKLKQRKIV